MECAVNVVEGIWSGYDILGNAWGCVYATVKRKDVMERWQQMRWIYTIWFAGYCTMGWYWKIANMYNMGNEDSGSTKGGYEGVL
jgi:hypothetical protein